MGKGYKRPVLTRHPHDDDEERNKADPEKRKICALVCTRGNDSLLIKSKRSAEAVLKRINMHAQMVSKSLTFRHGAGWLSAA